MNKANFYKSFESDEVRQQQEQIRQQQQLLVEQQQKIQELQVMSSEVLLLYLIESLDFQKAKLHSSTNDVIFLQQQLSGQYLANAARSLSFPPGIPPSMMFLPFLYGMGLSENPLASLANGDKSTIEANVRQFKNKLLRKARVGILLMSNFCFRVRVYLNHIRHHLSPNR